MLRSIVSSIEFEKFRRNWSKNEQLSVSLLWSLGKLKTLLPAVATLGREPVHYEICERFAPIFLRRTHVSLLEIYKELLLMPLIF
ncbi:hypothetical protein [Leptospira noguchii]|uniref:hypothetical protein n=1 Tax=Leptospira noguchii TaxID=28182 RepID=UPI001FB79B68|nr:hypothetical protein [Leptospira noguchii]UOG29792.1 hypothetical protein MAL06_14250 [Leptospira noguchii]